MRAKAIKSLERLKKLKNEKRKSVMFSMIHEKEWVGCKIDDGLREYIKLVSWCNKNVSKKYSRSVSTFWFEDKKDAFKFRLRWGIKS